MPSAIVTVRELKNKETGIDVTIPVYKEIKGLLQSTWEFYVVVVSNLPYFKSPKHKDTDVVQFMIPKRFADFESLHAKLTEKYPATILPTLPRKTLITKENVVKERKLSFEKFLQFIAMTNKLANSSVFLEFLGVNPIKAGKFRKDLEEQEGTEEKSETKDEETEEEEPRNLFLDDEEEQTDDLFTSGLETEDTNITLSTELKDTTDTKLFEDQDFGGGIEEGEEDLFFVPGSKEPAIITKRVNLTVEDNIDLLNIDDDLENVLNVKEETESKPSEGDKVTETSTQVQPKPEPTPKPSSETTKPPVAQKPSLPLKPKKSELDSKSSKPIPKPKPALPKKPIKQADNTDSKKAVFMKSDTHTPSKGVQSLETNDILQYIEANKENEDDIDLFS